MIWVLAIVSLFAFMLAFASHSAGWMGLCIAVGLVCGIAAGLVFIDRHLRASSRPEHMTDGEIEALRNTVRKPEGARPKLPPAPRD